MSPLILLRRGGVCLLVVLFCLSVPACGNKKVTKANYEKVKTGMTLAEVEGILGKGTKDEGGDGSGVAAQFGVDVSGGVGGGGGRPKNQDTYVWESGEKQITVYFANGKVTNKRESGL